MSPVNQPPLVSIIIPVFNAGPYLKETLQSVLAQTYAQHELIIIDDASSDASLDIVKQCAPCARIHRHAENQGLGAARNSGAALAQGAFFAFLDQDDIWSSDKLAKQVDLLQGRADIDMVFGRVEQFMSPDVPPEQRPAEPVIKIVDGIHAGTMLIRREGFAIAGLFATDWRVGEFLDWYSRALEQGLKALTMPQVMMYRRLHAHNMSRRLAHARSDFFKILKAKLDRERNTKNQNNDTA